MVFLYTYTYAYAYYAYFVYGTRDVMGIMGSTTCNETCNEIDRDHDRSHDGGVEELKVGETGFRG